MFILRKFQHFHVNLCGVILKASFFKRVFNLIDDGFRPDNCLKWNAFIYLKHMRFAMYYK